MKIKTHLLAELDAGEFSRPEPDTHCPNPTKESKRSISAWNNAVCKSGAYLQGIGPWAHPS